MKKDILQSHGHSVIVTYFSFPLSFSMSIFFILFNTRNITFNNYHKPQITYHIKLKIEMLKSILIIFILYILYIYYNIYIIIIVRKNLNVICDLWFVVFYFPCVYAETMKNSYG